MVEMIEEPKCATCPMRLKSEEKPNSLMARIWRWHTGWCPGWNAYIKELESKGLEVPTVGVKREMVT